MDPNDLLTMTWKWQRGDVARHTGGDLAAALGRITAKTFVLPIDEDMFFPPRDCRAEQEHIKGSELRVIKDVPATSPCSASPDLHAADRPAPRRAARHRRPHDAPPSITRCWRARWRRGVVDTPSAGDDQADHVEGDVRCLVEQAGQRLDGGRLVGPPVLGGGRDHQMTGRPPHRAARPGRWSPPTASRRVRWPARRPARCRRWCPTRRPRRAVSVPLTAGVVVSPMTNTGSPRCISRIANALAMNPERPSPVTKTRSAAISDFARPSTWSRSIACCHAVDLGEHGAQLIVARDGHEYSLSGECGERR